jgi:hypothetical protein
VRFVRRLPLATLIGVGLIATATAAAATVPSGARTASQIGGVVQPVPHATINATSGNWFGYNVSAINRRGLFNQIAGTWRVPTATQHKAGEAEHSSAWIGIGGGCLTNSCLVADNTLIQAGTEHDVDAGGTATYSAWFELIPGPSLQTTLAVKPGDLIRANINQVVQGLWNISLKNLTTQKNWSMLVPYSSTHLTAEWIAETPITIGTGGTGFAALPNLSQVHFDNALLNGANPQLKQVERVFLAPDGTHIIGAPSIPQPDGNGFGACTWSTTCSRPPNY